MSTNTASTAVTRVIPQEDLRAIKSFDDLGNYARDHQLPVVNGSEVLGDGFELCREKGELVGKPFVIVDYRFTESDEYKDENGNPLIFATIRLVTEDDRKLIINDGSTGIRDQLRSLPENVAGSLLYMARGLRVSEYEYTDERGRKSKAQTWYLNV